MALKSRKFDPKEVQRAIITVFGLKRALNSPSMTLM